jgi:hypothetical protein
MQLKYLLCVAAVAAPMAAFATDTVIVNDTFADGNRTTSGPDGGGIDSQWFASATANNTVTTGDMHWTVPAGSLFNTTYFPSATTPFGPQAVTLANPGDQLKVTWQFTLSTVNAANANQNFLVAVALTPGAHLTANGSPASEAYSGYSSFMNMETGNFGNTGLALKEWASPGTANNLLGTSAAWGANGVASANLAAAGTTGNVAGWENGVLYTYSMTLTLGNSGDLLINNTITGGTTLNGTGTLSVTDDDTTPNTLSFDTFGVREGTSSATAAGFDTSSFKVDLITTAPEPGTLSLLALGAVGLGFGYRRMRK